jgi:hypothetical protein
MPEKPVTIVVNATQEVIPSTTVTYDQVTSLAYPTPPAPNTKYTVTYKNAAENRSGSLVEGQSVEVKERGTSFDVDPTSKS